MKQFPTFLSIVLTATSIFAACGQDTSPSHVDAADKSKPLGTTLDAKAQEAMGAAKDAVAKGKEEWNKLAETKMPEVDQKIAELKERVSKASGSAKVELDKLVQEIGEKRKVVEQKLGELKTASAEQWQSARGDIDRALSDLKKSLDQALEKSK
jgi:hypothetical protein